MSSHEPAVAAAGSRREGRERILSLLYEAETKEVGLAELVAALPLPLTGYAATLVQGLDDEQSVVDELIDDASHRWKLSRMPAVDRALLRMGTHELLRRLDIPASAVISEAVELAAEYSTDGSSRFVNGVLARLAIELRPDEPNAVQDLEDLDAAGSVGDVDGFDKR